jgi:hypothetical protein
MCSRFSFYIHNEEIFTHSSEKQWPVRAGVYNNYNRASIKLDRKGDREQARALAKESQAINEEKGNIRQLAMQVVYACSSTEKLLKTWPEITQVVKIEATQQQSTSLVPTVTKLNKALGIAK